MTDAARFAVGETVFAYTEDLSWVVGTISSVQKNIAYKPLTDAQKSSVVADSLRKKINSKYLYTVAATDPLMLGGTEGGKAQPLTTIADVEEWNVDVYDSSIVQTPVDDLLSLTHLHDGSILRTLAVRYMKDIVYTNIGVIVVALNPFNFKIPHYQDDKMGSYMSEKGQMISEHLLPHSWAQAHNTYFEMCSTRCNQSILISGESGAGKTEAAKIVLKYLSNVSVTDGSAEEKQKANSIAAAVTACSPILEAFGNAKTVRNDNSSRFGKLMRLKFSTRTQLLLGAFTTKYLLEKSRIITCGLDERLYHAFYLAMRAPDAVTTNKFVKPHAHYRSIYAGKCIDNKEFSTTEDFKEVCEAMLEMKMTETTIKECWQIASAVVHACNSTFVSDGGEGSKIKDEESEAALRDACELWGVSYDVVLRECTTTLVTVAGETATKLLPVHKATDVKDALCKAVYGNLFEVLVEKCNMTCDYMGEEESWWIALLDIFGFENFDAPTGNSFEQLCINYANETLQQHYNWCIFTKDMEVCAAEGIDTVDIKFPDLQPTLTLVEKTLLYLDDECSLGTTEDAFLHSITSQFDKKEPAFMKNPSWRDKFAIHHFAGTVIYTVTGWLEKNRDMLKDTLKAEFNSDTNKNMLSRDLFLCQMRQEAAAAARMAAAGGATKGGKAKSVTLGGFFKTQMKDLMDVINSTNPHWIRCVKPHPAKKPLMFGGAYTLKQLEFAGILGTVKIRKAGYPIRFPLAKFCQQFCAIKPHEDLKGLVTGPAAPLAKHTNLLLSTMGYNAKQYAQVGKTIVFIKNDAYHLFEMARREASKKHVCLLQRIGAGLRARVSTFQLQKVQCMQRIGRGYRVRLATLARYVEINRPIILEKRRVAAELKAKQEAEKKRRRELMATLLAEHSAQRDAAQNAESIIRKSICQDEEGALISINSFFEHLSQEVYMAKLNTMIMHQLQPLVRDFEAGCEKLRIRESNELEQIMLYHRHTLVAIQTSDRVAQIEYQEEGARNQLEEMYVDAVTKLNEKRLGIDKKIEMLKMRNDYQRMLEADRERRRDTARNVVEQRAAQGDYHQHSLEELGINAPMGLDSPTAALPSRYALQKEIFDIASQYKSMIEAEERIKMADEGRQQYMEATTGDRHFGIDANQNIRTQSARQAVASSSLMDASTNEMMQTSQKNIHALMDYSAASLPNDRWQSSLKRSHTPSVHEYLRQAIPTSIYRSDTISPDPQRSPQPNATRALSTNTYSAITSAPRQEGMSSSVYRELSTPTSHGASFIHNTYQPATPQPSSPSLYQQTPLSVPRPPYRQGMHVFVPHLRRPGIIRDLYVASSRRLVLGIEVTPSGHATAASTATLSHLVWIEAEDVQLDEEEVLAWLHQRREQPPSPISAAETLHKTSSYQVIQDRKSSPRVQSPSKGNKHFDPTQARSTLPQRTYSPATSRGSLPRLNPSNEEIIARRRHLGLPVPAITESPPRAMRSVVSAAARVQKDDFSTPSRIHTYNTSTLVGPEAATTTPHRQDNVNRKLSNKPQTHESNWESQIRRLRELQEAS